MSHDHEIDEVDLLRWPDPLPESWQAVERPASGGAEQSFEVREHGEPRGTAEVRHVVRSRIAETYPVGHRDRLVEPSDDLTAEGLQLVSELVMRADPACRRLVVATAEGDVAAIGRAERAGYRYVVDVDLREGSLSLMAAEPAWVLEESRRIDDVPTH
ncbi:MAG: acetyltransferase [Microbacteriaceae bacterium]|nr:acetyltransferase [Microbacteriaceae bacterium]